MDIKINSSKEMINPVTFQPIIKVNADIDLTLEYIQDVNGSEEHAKKMLWESFKKELKNYNMIDNSDKGESIENFEKFDSTIKNMNPVREQKRTYYYYDPDGELFGLEFENIVAFKNSKTTHRLKDKDGSFFIVPNDFLFIEIEGIEGFSF